MARGLCGSCLPLSLGKSFAYTVPALLSHGVGKVVCDLRVIGGGTAVRGSATGDALESPVDFGDADPGGAG